MSERLTIRPAHAGEIEALAQLILAMAAESEGVMLNRGTLLNGMQAVFDDPARGCYWVIAQEPPEGEAGPARLLGGTLITSEWSDWHNTCYWWIQSLYIVPERRGQGLFEQLLTHLEQAGKAQNVREIRLYVDQNNQRAIRTYVRNGFESDHYRCMTKSLSH